MRHRIMDIFSFSLFLIVSMISITAWSCTGIQLKAKDGSYVNGRTVEFGMKLDLTVMVIPRKYEFKGTLPDGSTGMTYQAKYAVVGANTFGSPAIVDGVNEKGLTVAMFYFPGYANYATITPENKNKALSPIEFPNWIVTQFATTDEIKQHIKSVVIAPTTPKGWPGLPPFHYIVYDKSGKSIVIEPTNGQLKVYDNPIGVLTNSPAFDWHLTNLANYVNLSPINSVPVTIDGLKLKQFGEGSGLHGLPGDFTPPSRFIRAAVFSSSAIPSDNADQTVLQIFHILNQFDIPVGSVRSIDDGKVIPEFTLATAVKDPQSLRYYIRMFDDQTIKMIDLNAFDLNAKTLKYVGLAGTQPVVNISASAKE